jgi:hypothetical protein
MPRAHRRITALALALAFAFVFASAATRALAQGMQSPAQWYINQQIYSTRVFNGVFANSMLDATRGTGAGAAAGAGTAAATAATPPRDVTRFTPQAASLAPARLAAREGGDPRARERYESFVALYAQVARKDGFPADDLAYAYEYFVVNGYHIWHDLLDLPTDRDPYLRDARDGFERIELAARKRQQQVAMSEERAIYEQFRRQLGASAEVQRMSDAEKQEAAEMLAISYGVAYAGYMRAIETGDEALREDARRSARLGLEKMLGRPIERIRIGYGGLEP